MNYRNRRRVEDCIPVAIDGYDWSFTQKLILKHKPLYHLEHEMWQNSYSRLPPACHFYGAKYPVNSNWIKKQLESANLHRYLIWGASVKQSGQACKSLANAARKYCLQVSWYHLQDCGLMWPPNANTPYIWNIQNVSYFHCCLVHMEWSAI